MTTFNFSGKTVLITGGTKGIGKAILESFEKAGAEVIATGTNKKQIAELNDLHSNRTYLCVDFTDKDSRDKFLNKISDLSRKTVHTWI